MKIYSFWLMVIWWVHGSTYHSTIMFTVRKDAKIAAAAPSFPPNPSSKHNVGLTPWFLSSTQV